jgi:hypothetical protein
MAKLMMTGAEFKEWHETAWPKGYVWAYDSVYTPQGSQDVKDIYFEDPSLKGKDAITVGDAEVFEVPEDWFISWEGIDLQGRVNGDARDDLSISQLIKRWRKSRSVVTLVLEVPKDQLDEVKAWLKEKNLKTL